MNWVRAARFYWYDNVDDIDKELRKLPSWHPDVDGLLEARAELVRRQACGRTEPVHA